jgi:hypothetical protein
MTLLHIVAAALIAVACKMLVPDDMFKASSSASHVAPFLG